MNGGGWGKRGERDADTLNWVLRCRDKEGEKTRRGEMAGDNSAIGRIY